MTVKKRSKFNMSKLRSRAQKVIRKKCGTKIPRREIQKIWRDYVEYGIIRPLLKYGKVQVDQNFSIEIVGKKIVNDPKLFNLVVKGLNVVGGVIKEANFDDNRMGVKYKIKVTDKNYKTGQLIFEADKKLSNRVHEQLKNTNQYYRIES